MVRNVRTIKKAIKNEIIIQKSRFITLLYPIQSKDEVLSLLQSSKNEYRNATHYCYAYIIDNIAHCSDDGEPSKTAGMPMLNVLQGNQLDHILAITIRYFGGIKLGAGGLVRAYSNSVSKALENATITEYTPGIEISITFPYSEVKQVDYILQHQNIIKKEYNKDITYIVQMNHESFSDIQKRLKIQNINIKIIKEVYVEKK